MIPVFAAATPGLDKEEPEFNNERDIPQDDDKAEEAGDAEPQERPATGDQRQ